MGKYCRILEEVEAVQAKDYNLDELKNFSRKDVKGICRTSEELPVYYIIPGIDSVLWIGDWLIRHENGRLEIKKNNIFHQEYEPK